MPAPTDSELTHLAGPAAFKRGQSYFREERVSLLRVDGDGFEAQAEGSETYGLTLRRDSREWIGECSCPVDGFCKHLVAACLLWRDGRPAPVRDELAEFVHAQPAERLASWLLDLARDDRAVEKRLKLLASRGQPEQMRKLLGEMLTAQGFLDHKRSNDYARRLSVPLRELSSLLVDDPAQCHALCDYALQRLLTIVERADDSSGAIQDRIHAVAALYSRAAASAPALDRRRMAKSLHARQQNDDWGFLPIETYWMTLGEAGQAQYSKLVEAELANLAETQPSHRSGETREAFGTLRRIEALARVRGDFDTLQSVLSRDLTFGGSYARLVETSREFGRFREAMQWAERGVKAHPSWPGLHTLLAEELQRTGFGEEALDALWKEFHLTPGPDQWLGLKRAADPALHPQYRERALEYLGQLEQKFAHQGPDCGRRLDLLMADGDLAAALDLVRQMPAGISSLLDLAARLADKQPNEAAALIKRTVERELPGADNRQYARLVERMALVVRLAPGPESLQWVAGIKALFRARPKLMGLISAQGL